MTFGAGLFGAGTFGTPGWQPGDPWPSATAGGAWSPYWGGYVRLWVRAAIAAGNPFHIGPHANAQLDSGNVVTGAQAAVQAVPERLWVDLSCDVIDLEVAGGASSASGVLTKPDAATLVATIADPDGIYDPLNRSSPFAYGGRSRLRPGTPVEAFAEVVDGDTGTVSQHWLFTGTADSWGEDWTPRASDRQCELVATDATKQWANYDAPEQNPQGNNDTITQRVDRLVAFYQWLGTVEHDPAGGTVTLDATTLANPGWENLHRTLDDELGYVYFTTDGALRWVNRDTWLTVSDPVIVLGCPDVTPAARDVLIDASPSLLDAQMRNVVHAARTGGTAQTALSQSSIDQYGRYDYQRTDLGLADDAQVSAWAQQLLLLYAYPQVSLEDVTMRPDVDARSWEVWDAVLGIAYVSDLVRVAWAPPGLPDNVVDGTVRVVGHTHRITRQTWEVQWQLVNASPLAGAGSIFTMGPHANARLDAGMILGLT